MKRLIIYFLMITLCLLAVTLPLSAAPAKNQPLIQLAILLDTSNSMDGLIEQAKTQIWNIVNELALAKKNGKIPRLEVGLYEYGNNNIPVNKGYVRLVQPLTTDLDKISEELFKLTTYGGDEYCGKVIYEATRNLKWSRDKNDYKMLVIAGNEPFTQGSTDYQKACRDAIRKGIIVNTIFCGDFQEGIDTKWKDGADLSDGTYANINQDQQMIAINAPQDAEILKLNQQLNETYVPYGSTGKESKERQEAEDTNALSFAPQIAVQRSNAKASGMYQNSVWDLVDAVKSKGFGVLDTIKTGELPPEMQKMTKAEQKEYLEKKIQQRGVIQAKITQLNKERQAFVDKETQKQSQDNSLGKAIINAIRSQAGKKNFKFN